MLSSAIVLRIPPKLQMTDDEFFEFCQINSKLRIERNKSGELVIRPLEQLNSREQRSIIQSNINSG